MKIIDIFNDLITIFPYFLQGYIALYIWERIIPSSKKKIKDYYLEILFVGALFKLFNNYLNSFEFLSDHKYITFFILAILTLGSPFLINWILKIKKIENLFHSSSDPSAWDAFFSRGSYCYVIVNLKGSDKEIIGYFGKYSFATPYPYKGDLFLEAEYIRNNEKKLIKRKNSMGIYIKAEEISHLTFIAI